MGRGDGDTKKTYHLRSSPDTMLSLMAHSVVLVFDGDALLPRLGTSDRRKNRIERSRK